MIAENPVERLHLGIQLRQDIPPKLQTKPPGCAILITGVVMLDNLFQPMHLLVILFIALLVFGPKKLPELGKGLGEGIRSFKDSMNAKDDTTPKPEEQKKP
jgi:sec-independent protein translocase protein TatA